MTVTGCHRRRLVWTDAREDWCNTCAIRRHAKTSQVARGPVALLRNLAALPRRTALWVSTRRGAHQGLCAVLSHEALGGALRCPRLWVVPRAALPRPWPWVTGHAMRSMTCCQWYGPRFRNVGYVPRHTCRARPVRLPSTARPFPLKPWPRSTKSGGEYARQRAPRHRPPLRPSLTLAVERPVQIMCEWGQRQRGHEGGVVLIISVTTLCPKHPPLNGRASLQFPIHVICALDARTVRKSCRHGPILMRPMSA